MPTRKTVAVPPRVEVLQEAESYITGDRNVSYGSPTQNFQDIADMWTIQFRHMLKDDVHFEPGHIAEAMVLLKMCRQKSQPKRDNWTDTAGYSGCGYEADVESGRI